jgi:hypothetical protein
MIYSKKSVLQARLSHAGPESTEVVMMLRVAIGLAFLLGCSAVAWETTAAPVKWKKSEGGNNHLYEVVLPAKRINWVEAHLRATARGCGWHLATITSAAENDFIKTLLPSIPEIVHGFWLGGFQRDSNNEPAGSWRWVTSEPFMFTDWAADNPDNGFAVGGQEDFLSTLFPFHEWNDLQNNWQDPPVGFVVELDSPRKRGRC